MIDSGPVQVRHRAAGRFEVGLPANCKSSPKLILPYFETTPDDPLGPNTFFAVRNNWSTKDWAYALYDEWGSRRLTSSRRAPHREVVTVNLGEKIAGLRNQSVRQSLSRGFVEIYTSNPNNSNPLEDGTGALAGDFFLVDSRNDFASGGILPRRAEDACSVWTTRFLNGGPFSGGTRLLVHAYHATFFADVYDEAGRYVKTILHQGRYRYVASVDLATLIGPTPQFGSLRITMPIAGHLFVEHRASGKYAVGLPANCLTPR